MANCNINEILNEVLDIIAQGITPFPFVKLVKYDHCMQSTHCFSVPLLSLTVQGRKLIQAGQQEFELVPGTILVTCVDMPNTSAILEASPERPFLGLGVKLDRKIMADIMADMASPTPNGPGDGFSSIWLMKATCEFMDAFLRMARLWNNPDHAAILGPLIMRELHFLLLISPLGAVLRHLYMHGGRDNRIIDVIAWLKRNLGNTFAMEDLARRANMSVSSFHRHFKAITGVTPLQYHKNLRLYEAQRLMLTEEQRVSEASAAVGYESVAQFNREYRRMFGESPKRDVLRRMQKLKK